MRSEEQSICPVCGGSLNVIGTRERTVWIGNGGKETLVIRRLCCTDCGKIHHELPDCVVPYKRYSAEVIEDIIRIDAENPCCENSTIWRIKRWWATFCLYFRGVLASLTEKYDVVFSANPTLKEIVRAVVNAHLWIHTRSAFLTGGGSAMLIP